MTTFSRSMRLSTRRSLDDSSSHCWTGSELRDRLAHDRSRHAWRVKSARWLNKGCTTSMRQNQAHVKHLWCQPHISAGTQTNLYLHSSIPPECAVVIGESQESADPLCREAEV